MSPAPNLSHVFQKRGSRAVTKRVSALIPSLRSPFPSFLHSVSFPSPSLQVLLPSPPRSTFDHLVSAFFSPNLHIPPPEDFFSSTSFSPTLSSLHPKTFLLNFFLSYSLLPTSNLQLVNDSFYSSPLNLNLNPYLSSTMPRGDKAGNSTVWDDKAHSDLLICLLPVVKPTKVQWDEVIKRAEAKGYHYNASAVQYITLLSLFLVPFLSFLPPLLTRYFTNLTSLQAAHRQAAEEGGRRCSRRCRPCCPQEDCCQAQGHCQEGCF